MDIQQILATVKTPANGAKGGGDAMTAGDFAAALATLSSSGGKVPAEGLETGSGSPQGLASLTALAQGAPSADSPLPEGLESLTPLPAAEGVPEALLAKLSEAARRVAGSPTDGDAEAPTSPELAAAMERLALIQGAAHPTPEAALPVMSPALGQAAAQLAAGQPAPAARGTQGAPDTAGTPNRVLEAGVRPPATGQAPAQPLPTTAEAAAKATDGQAPLTPPATPSPQAMAEALTARREGGQQELPHGAIGLAGVGGQASPTPASAPGAPGLSAPAPQQAALTAPVDSPAWPRQLGQQLVRLGRGGGEQRIEMQLHPAELGPLSVTLKVGDQGAQAQFLSAHAQVRQAVEQALPQLREALAEQGIALGEASVGEQRTGGGDGDGSRFADGSGIAGGTDGEEGDAVAGMAEAPSSGVSLDGRVDLYA